MVQERSAQRILVGETEGKRPLGGWISKKLDGTKWPGFMWSRSEQVAACSEHGEESLGFH